MLAIRGLTALLGAGCAAACATPPTAEPAPREYVSGKPESGAGLTDPQATGWELEVFVPGYEHDALIRWSVAQRRSPSDRPIELPTAFGLADLSEHSFEGWIPWRCVRGTATSNCEALGETNTAFAAGGAGLMLVGGAVLLLALTVAEAQRQAPQRPVAAVVARPLPANRPSPKGSRELLLEDEPTDADRTRDEPIAMKLWTHIDDHPFVRGALLRVAESYDWRELLVSQSADLNVDRLHKQWASLRDRAKDRGHEVDETERFNCQELLKRVPTEARARTVAFGKQRDAGDDLALFDVGLLALQPRYLDDTVAWTSLRKVPRIAFAPVVLCKEPRQSLTMRPEVYRVPKSVEYAIVPIIKYGSGEFLIAGPPDLEDIAMPVISPFPLRKGTVLATQVVHLSGDAVSQLRFRTPSSSIPQNLRFEHGPVPPDLPTGLDVLRALVGE